MRRQVVLLGLAACAAALVLHLYPVVCPLIRFDDFQILRSSWTWPNTLADLWLPQNEHAMPLGRLSTHLLVLLAGRLTAVPRLIALQGPLALVAGMVLVYLFVRRETGQPFYGLIAMAFFGISSVYQGAVAWFAASFTVLSLDTLLLALLAAQRWRQTGQIRYLILCVLGTALAPGWFSIGFLAGPLCCLYLLPFSRDTERNAPPGGGRLNGWFLVPLLGTLAFLAVSWPLTYQHILGHLDDGRRAMGYGRMLQVGLEAAPRAVVDNLLPGAIGIPAHAFPVWLVIYAWAVLGAAVVWWWRRAPHRPLLTLGLGLIFLSYVLAYGGRAHLSYEEDMYSWTRYQLWPHLGLVLFVCGGLPRGQAFPLRDETAAPEELPRRSAHLIIWLIVVLFLCQLPHSLYELVHSPIGLGVPHPEQRQALEAIEEMDARCREYHISAETAREALGWQEVPVGGDQTNAWDYLRGSPEPRPVTVEEARRLLLHSLSREQ